MKRDASQPRKKEMVLVEHRFVDAVKLHDYGTFAWEGRVGHLAMFRIGKKVTSYRTLVCSNVTGEWQEAKPGHIVAWGGMRHELPADLDPEALLRHLHDAT